MRYSGTDKYIPGIYIGNRGPLVREFPNCKVIFNRGYHYVSGFVGFPSGKWVYFCSFDDRYGDFKYYVRTAANEKDYTGGRNNFTRSNDKEQLFKLIRELSTVNHIPT